MKDRRRYPRHDAWFPVQLDTGDAVGLWGCCVDGSASGLLLRSPVLFVEGETVNVTFKVLSSQKDWLRARASVIRADIEPEGSDDPWPVSLALHLWEPILKLEMLFPLLDDRQRYGDPRTRRRLRALKSA